jgi:hypothetical protein
MFTVVSITLGGAIAAALLFGLARAYRTLENVELVALWWWAAIAVLAVGGLAGPTYLLLGFAGVLMVGLGLFVALNVRGIADRLGKRRMGIGAFWTQQSAAYWRFAGVFLIIIGAFWTLAFKSAF